MPMSSSRRCGKWLADVRPVDPKLAVITVFGVLDRHIDAGQVAKVKGTLPHEIRALWDEAAAQVLVAFRGVTLRTKAD